MVEVKKETEIFYHIPSDSLYSSLINNALDKIKSLSKMNDIRHC